MKNKNERANEMQKTINEIEKTISTKEWKIPIVEGNSDWGQFAIVDVKNLIISTVYQRDISPANVKRIVENFVTDQFGAIKVGRRKSTSKYHVIDGQHRVVAAEILGIKKVPCLIVAKDGETTEARIFKEQVNRQTVGAYHIYRAAIAGGFELECQIKDWLDSINIEMGRSCTSRQIGFVTGFINRWKKDEEACKNALLTLLQLDPDSGLDGGVHGGLWYLESKGIKTSDHIKKMKAVGSSPAIISAANALLAEARISSGSQTRPRLYALAIAKLVNKGRRSNKISLSI